VPALLLVAVAVGLSNFAAAVGIGVSGVDARTRLRIGLVFGLFEAGMPLVGLLLGHGLAEDLGHAARWTAAGILAACGGYAVLQAVRGHDAAPAVPGQPGEPAPGDEPGTQEEPAPQSGLGLGRLLITGLALSIDNLAVGFALGAYHVSLPLAAVIIGTVSVALSLAGLELGARIGARAGQRGELLGGLVLIGVGVAVAAGMS
jgi:manganese efflux pump family protein